MCLAWSYAVYISLATGNPRALWVGLEFVRYALTKVWLGSDAAAQCGALTRGKLLCCRAELKCQLLASWSPVAN